MMDSEHIHSYLVAELFLFPLTRLSLSYAARQVSENIDFEFFTGPSASSLRVHVHVHESPHPGQWDNREVSRSLLMFLASLAVPGPVTFTPGGAHSKVNIEC